MTFEPTDRLLLVWVHGFKGNEVTFEGLPDRLVHLLSSTHPSLQIVSRVFPAYQTRGDLGAAVLAFVDWLTGLVVELENDGGRGGGAGRARVMLMGHSMGGLLCADAALDVWRNTREGEEMWPRIVGVMAFDTPYLGLHPHVFKHGLNTAAQYYEQAKGIASAVGMLSPAAIALGAGKFWPGASSSSASSSTKTATSSKPGPASSSKAAAKAPAESEVSAATKSSWWSSLPAIPAIPQPSTKALYGLGAVALGAAAVGTAYYRREDFLNGWKWGYDHMTFVGNLWDAEALRARLDGLEVIKEQRAIEFWNYYTHLPAAPPGQLVARTFTILPPASHPLSSRWVPASNTVATDEVGAHMGMFNPVTNDGFYDLGLEVAASIAARLEQDGVRRGTEGHGGEEVEEKERGAEERGGLEGWREEKQGEKTVLVEL